MNTNITSVMAPCGDSRGSVHGRCTTDRQARSANTANGVSRLGKWWCGRCGGRTRGRVLGWVRLAVVAVTLGSASLAQAQSGELGVGPVVTPVVPPVVNVEAVTTSVDEGSDGRTKVVKVLYSSEELRAGFEQLPAAHGGYGDFTFRLAFSEPIARSFRVLRDHALQAKAGQVMGARRVDGRSDLWQITVKAWSRHAVTVRLIPGNSCDDPNAVCTEDGRLLANAPVARILGPAGLRVADAEAREGEDAAVRFLVTLGRPSAETVTVDYRTWDGTAAAGEDYEASSGTITLPPGATEHTIEVPVLDDEKDEGDETFTLALFNASGAWLKDGQAVGTIVNEAATTSAGEGSDGKTKVVKVLYSSEELRAGFEQLPAAHGGYGDFTFRLAFSEPIARSFRVLRDHALQAKAGQVMGARRVDGRSDLWQITVKAWSRHAVTVRLIPGNSCDDPNAICTEDGRLLTNGPVARIPGPPGLSVSDGQATEGEDAAVRFLVTLGRPSTRTVTVGYRTWDSTATAGEDYEASSGTITLPPGATEHAIEVPVLDDGKDDGEETFTLVLFNASGAWLKDAQAVGTIVNSDPLPKAWLSRFGRTAASHIVDAVSERVSEEPAAGSRVVIGGVRPEGIGAISGREESSTLGFQSLSSDDQRRVLAGSSFRWSSPAESETPEEGGSTPGWTAWGRGATTSFGGNDDGVRLDGDVVTGTVGVDYEGGRTLTGLALSYSDGVGEYRAAGGEGDLRTSLTSVTPYLRVALNDRLDVWGLLGYGQGDLTLRDDGEGRATETGTDTGMRMGAVGLRGSVLSGPAFDLAIRSDAFWVRADSDATVGLRSAAADATRLRVALEGSRSFELEQGGLFQPSLELGLRYDGGDGETGGGLEVGGAVRYSNPTRGLTFGLNARSLLAHEASGFEEWGAGGSVRLDPGASGRGLSLDLRSSVGTASSGVQRLWSERETAALTRNGGLSDTGRLEAELGYGVGVAAGRGLLTPYGIVSAADGVQAYGVGSRFLLGESFSLGLEASRRERESVAPEGTVTLRAQWRLGSGRSGQGGRGTRSAASTPGS